MQISRSTNGESFTIRCNANEFSILIGGAYCVASTSPDRVTQIDALAMTIEMERAENATPVSEPNAQMEEIHGKG